MDLSAFKIHGCKALMTVLALTVAAGAAHANVLTATPSTQTMTCNTATGPGNPTTVIVKPATPLTGAATVVVTFSAPANGITVTAPNVTTLSTTNQVAGLIYTLTMANGCVGVTTGTPTFHFNAGGNSDVTVTINSTLVNNASGLAASNVTVTCARLGAGSYLPGPAQTVSVTSAAVGGTAFTIDPSPNPALPSWLSISSLAGGTATSTPVTFTVAATGTCGGGAAPSTATATLHLLNGPGPDKTVVVTLQILPPSPLIATPTLPTLSYVKGSGNAGKVDVAFSSSAVPNAFFAVDTSSLPSWLTVDSVTGSVPKSVRFSSTSIADTLAPGTYTAPIRIKVSQYADLSVSISILITNTAPKLTLAEPTTRTIPWTLGSAIPTPFITAVSSDSPIAYSIVTGGTLQPTVPANMAKGLAYSFGTQIPISFNSLIFASAQPGTTLTGTATITWGTPALTIVVTFNVPVISPGATVSGLAPASIPTAAAGQTFTVSMSGSGFVPSTDPAQKTKVGVLVSGQIVTDTNIATTVVDSSHITLVITVPATADPNLPFSPSGNGGAVSLGVCNPVGGTCSIPGSGGTTTLSIGTNPIIQAVTSSSAFVQVTPPALQSIAPYDIVSIFGTNFCSSGGTGCTSSQVMYGAPDPTTFRYPSTLSPDSTGAGQRLLSVTFQTHGVNPTPIPGTAPLLFATNNQINMLVPSTISAQIGNTIDIVVNFGYGTGATLKSSAPFAVTAVATNPGIFTVGANGQGDGAILNSSWAVITAANPAGIRANAIDSDTVTLFVTGLGAPDSTGDNATAGSGYTYSSDCVSISTFLASLNAADQASFATLDGNVLQSSLLSSNRLVPCISASATNVPTVSIGGVNAPVLYAGWVADTIAGLYQINVSLPALGGGPFTPVSGPQISTLAAPVQLPVTITANSKHSQAGVTMWVAPRLQVNPPSGAGLSGTVGIVWNGTSIASVQVANGSGQSPYRFALTAGLLPSGLTLNPNTGYIAGTPGASTAGSYIVTVQATDSANIPVTGTTTFTLAVAGGLVLTTNGTAPFTGTFGTANSTLTTVTAAGGIFPYLYTITSPGSLPAGMTINPGTGVIGISALTPAGTYHLTVHAIDSTSGTPLAGNVTFDVVVALAMANTTVVPPTHAQVSAVSTVSVTGNTGNAPVYSLDAATLAAGYFSINSSTGVLSTTANCTGGSFTAVVIATDNTAPSMASAAGTGTISIPVTVQ